jgi:hypothetical protein
MNHRVSRPWISALAAALAAALLVLPGQPATAQEHSSSQPGTNLTQNLVSAQASAEGVTQHQAGCHGNRAVVFASELAFRNDMRKLWEDHIIWTRVAIVSFAADLPDFGLTAERLLRNQADIGDAFAPFYGRDAADELTGLLREHILIAVDVLTAAKAGDEPGLADALARWDANADDLAAFLNAANPENWPLGETRAMLGDHLSLTTQEAVARLSGDFAADIAAYDAIHDQILEMADMLSTGVICQFPDHFRPGS